MPLLKTCLCVSVFNVQAAFRVANKAANSIYDHPPPTVNYIAGGGGAHKMATFELKTHENGLRVYQEKGKVGPMLFGGRLHSLQAHQDQGHSWPVPQQASAYVLCTLSSLVRITGSITGSAPLQRRARAA